MKDKYKSCGFQIEDIYQCGKKEDGTYTRMAILRRKM